MTDPVARTALWQSVDLLTKSTRVQVVRNDYTATWTSWATVPSLWQQTSDPLATAGGVGAGTDPHDRAPCDLGLLTIRDDIETTVRHELHRLAPGEVVRATVPGQIRHWASTVIAHDPDRLETHAARAERWVSLLTARVAAERTTQPMRIRRSACPNCGASQSVVHGTDADGPTVVPSLVVDARNGRARCLTCGQTWFPPELAALLGCHNVA